VAATAADRNPLSTATLSDAPLFMVAYTLQRTTPKSSVHSIQHATWQRGRRGFGREKRHLSPSMYCLSMKPLKCHSLTFSQFPRPAKVSFYSETLSNLISR
jgi:hypothetical protein